MSNNITQISCKTCNANLRILGNIYRSKMLSCQYCGTVMDSQHAFKALYAFTHIQQPSTSLRIGMQGCIRKVNFEITGYIAYKSREAKWLDFQLYSPTHGYAQLISKEGKYLFLRRTHYLPDTHLWMLKKGDQLTAQHITFQITAFYFAEVYYAAGNLTHVVKQGKRNKQCFAKQGKQWFISIQKRALVEYYSGVEMGSEEIEILFI